MTCRTASVLRHRAAPCRRERPKFGAGEATLAPALSRQPHHRSRLAPIVGRRRRRGVRATSVVARRRLATRPRSDLERQPSATGDRCAPATAGGCLSCGPCSILCPSVCSAVCSGGGRATGGAQERVVERGEEESGGTAEDGRTQLGLFR